MITHLKPRVGDFGGDRWRREAKQEGRDVWPAAVSSRPALPGYGGMDQTGSGMSFAILTRL